MRLGCGCGWGVGLRAWLGCGIADSHVVIEKLVERIRGEWRAHVGIQRFVLIRIKNHVVVGMLLVAAVACIVCWVQCDGSSVMGWLWGCADADAHADRWRRDGSGEVGRIGQGELRWGELGGVG